MTRVDDALLRRMVETIVDEVDPEQVILFGSRARGDAAADSDVDFVVVETAPFGKSRDRRAETTRLWRAPCAKAKCSMSDIKQARVLLEAAERPNLEIESTPP